ncbi:MAG: CehA/McbA family metallohydrolase, partial [Planctomycetaceae bacterium]|nr:CehA/McbA family metallohydrolase [Planctomycetaceae bacterium]
QGKVHAVNIFYCVTRSSFKDSYYQYLNAGFKIPFSTGTDWFQYDFSRVYARQTGPVTTSSWLTSLRAGRTFITNGPLLDLRVNDQMPGDQLKLTAAQNQIHIQAAGRGRVDFQKIELIHNGNIILTQPSSPVGNHFEAHIDQRIPISGPGWIALRTPSPSVPPDPARQQKTPLNELGRELFSHTSPVYLEWEGQILRNRKQSQAFLTEMTQNREKIAKQFLFADEQERAQVLDVYSDAIEILSRQLNSE